MSCNLWGSFASVVPIVSQLGNTLSKFHRMYTVLQTVELCLIYFFKKCRQCNRRNLPCSFNHFSYREMALQILTLFRGLFFSFPHCFKLYHKTTSFYISFWWVLLFLWEACQCWDCEAVGRVFCVLEESVRLFSQRVMPCAHSTAQLASQAPSVPLAVVFDV